MQATSKKRALPELGAKPNRIPEHRLAVASKHSAPKYAATKDKPDKQEDARRDTHIAAVAAYAPHFGHKRKVMTLAERKQHHYSRYRVYNEDFVPDPKRDALPFCMLEIEHMCRPNATPEVHMYGVSPDGTGVCVRARGFEPYFYAALPETWVSQWAQGDRARVTQLALQWHDHMREWTRAQLQQDEKLMRKYGRNLRDGHAILPLTREEIEQGVVIYNAKDTKGCTIDFRASDKGEQEMVPCVRIRTSAPQLVPFVRQYLFYPLGVDSSACALCGGSDPAHPGITSPFTDDTRMPYHEFEKKVGKLFLDHEKSIEWPAVVGHGTRCSAVFHSACIRNWRRAQRLRGELDDHDPTITKKDEMKPLFSCPCCTSDAHEIRTRHFERPETPVPCEMNAKKKRKRSMYHDRIEYDKQRARPTASNNPNRKRRHEPESSDESSASSSDEEHTNEMERGSALDAHSFVNTNVPNKHRRVLLEEMGQDGAVDEQQQGSVHAHSPLHSITHDARGTHEETHVRPESVIKDPWEAKTVLRGWFHHFAYKVRQQSGRDLPLPCAWELESRCARLRAQETRTLNVLPTMTAYDANVEFTTRFMIDCNLPPSQWVYLPSNTYELVPDSGARSDGQGRQSARALEVICAHEDLARLEHVYPREGEQPLKRMRLDTSSDTYRTQWLDARKLIEAPLPGLVELVYDGEMCPNNGRFPCPSRDAILQWGMAVRQSDQPWKQAKLVIMTLGSLAHSPPPDTRSGIEPDVYSFNSEEELIENICAFVRVVQPDLHKHWNGNSFDIPYLVARAKRLGLHCARNFGSLSCTQDTYWSGGRVRTRSITKVNLPGAVCMDELMYAQENFGGYEEFNLNAFSEKMLGENKVDLAYELIPELQRTSTGRADLAEYLMYDVLLTLELGDSMRCTPNSFARSRATSSSIQSLIQRGQQDMSLKMIRFLMRDGSNCALVYGSADLLPLIPTNRPKEQDPGYEGIGYGGAEVIKPAAGYYGPDAPKKKNQTDISTLDFASLYPSIMRKHGLCFSTAVMPEVARLLGMSIGQLDQTDTCSWQRPDHVFHKRSIDTVPNASNPSFVRDKYQMGIIPLLLVTLGAIRKGLNAHKDKLIKIVVELKAAKRDRDDQGRTLDSYEEEITDYDARQAQVKVAMNALYGFLGLSRVKGQVAMPDSAETVTKYGRYYLNYARVTTINTVRPENGFPCKARVIYGDTDSIFIALEGPKHITCNLFYMASLSKFLCALINKGIGGVLSLEWEKCFITLLMVGPKFYMGLMWMPSGLTKIEQKGIKAKRRDSDAMQRMATEILKKRLITDFAFELALKEIGRIIADLKARRVPMYELSTTGSFTKGIYSPDITVTSAVTVARKIHKRTGREPQPGERLCYVHVVERKKVCKTMRGKPQMEKKTQRAELLSYALEHNLPYDEENAIERVENSVIRLLRLVGRDYWNTDEERAEERIKAKWHAQPEFKHVERRVFDDSPMLKFMKLETGVRCLKCKATLPKRAEAVTHAPAQKRQPLALEVVSNNAGQVQHRLFGTTLEDTFASMPEYECVRSTLDNKERQQIRIHGPGLYAALEGTCRTDERQHQTSQLCEACASTSEPVREQTQALRTAHKKLAQAFDECRTCAGARMRGSNTVLNCASPKCKVKGKRAHWTQESHNASRRLHAMDPRGRVRVAYE